MVGTERRNTYIRYTIGFFVVLAILAFYFVVFGKTPIWEASDKDGLTQHWSSLAYLGRYLRDIIRNLFQGNGLILPEWNFSIGYGADILTTLHYYAIGDPLNLLTVFVPTAYTEVLYVVLVILRLYLAGAAFIAFCRGRGNRGIAVVIGAWIYVFAAYTLRIGIHYPFFYNVLIYFPLMLLGADKIFKKEKPYLFILTVAVSALSSFYFFYVQCLMLVLYAVFRYISEYGKPKFGTLVPLAGRFLAYGVIGVMMGAAIFLPVVMTMFGSQRAAAGNYVPVLYDLGYYLKAFANPLSISGSGYNNYLGFAAPALLFVFVLFIRKKEERPLKVGVIMLFVFTLIPFVGHVMNGFSYVTNRWEWALLMLTAYISVKTFPWILDLTRREKQKLLLITFFYAIICILIDEGRTDQTMSSLVILCLTAGVVCGYRVFFRGRRRLELAVIVLLILSLGVNINALYNPSQSNNINEYTDAGTTYSKMVTDIPSSVLTEKQARTTRYDQYGTEQNHNTAILAGKMSTDYYYSLSNGLVGQFFQELNINFPYEMIYTDLDSRMALDALMSVKYFVTTEDETNLPALFTKKIGEKEIGGQIYHAYKTDSNLPLGYTYDSYISRESYEKMTALQRQQALLQGVVMEKSTLPETELAFDDQEIPFTVTCNESVRFEENRIVVTGDNAHIRIKFKKEIQDAEIYASVQNADFTSMSEREQYTDEQWDELSKLGKNKIKRNDLFRVALNGSNMWFKSGNVSRCIMIRNARHDYFCGRTNFVTNLGCNNIKDGTVDMYFSEKGIYTFDRLSFHAQPTASLQKLIQERGKESLQDIQLGNDTLTGQITVSRDKVLCLSIPYSDGWKAYVDGKETDVLQANTMMMGIPLQAGKHSIRLVYANPAFHLGVWISFAGVVIFVLLCLVNFFYKKRNQSEIKKEGSV